MSFQVARRSEGGVLKTNLTRKDHSEPSSDLFLPKTFGLPYPDNFSSHSILVKETLLNTCCKTKEVVTTLKF